MKYSMTQSWIVQSKCRVAEILAEGYDSHRHTYFIERTGEEPVHIQNSWYYIEKLNKNKRIWILIKEIDDIDTYKMV